ncbi:hypothetical protein B0H14DRAFT_2555095 [Mycena olivaceomarginata]|nr:hypothetical protein B0H14DRAFT_2555095 [Mycena olivaceomarginata]
MAPLHLSLACWDYDRVKALEDGRVKPEGIDLNFLNLRQADAPRVEETFFRQLRYQEFDISELSLSSYVLTLNSEDPPFYALPVFPSRFFRHQSIYVNTKAGITHPSQLCGRRVGTPEFQMTAPVWQRGILEDEYGLKYDAPHYLTGNVEPSDVERKEKVPLNLGDTVNIQPIPKGKCLAHMLADGEIDALESASVDRLSLLYAIAYAPSSAQRPLPSENTQMLGVFSLTRCKSNKLSAPKEYFRRTGIFPIMHVIVVKRSILKEHPWVARSLTKAFATAFEYVGNF